MKNVSKRLAVLGVGVLFAFNAFADEAPFMVIQKTDGTKVNVEVAGIRSIKFKDGVMVIYQKTGSTDEIELGSVKLMSFESMTTAIEAIVGLSEEKVMTITDMSGRVAYKGLSKDFCGKLHGMYIISTEGRSQKVYIK